MTKAELKFGFAVPQGWRWLDEGLGNTAVKQYQFSRKVVQIAEAIGYNSVYAYDHFFPIFKENHEKNFFECYTLISAIAATTKRLKIGQIVSCNSFRNPSLLAKMLSTLDAISNGRIELGLGAGWYKDEYNSYGYDYLPDKMRIKQLDEALSIIRAMWVKRNATFIGQYYSIKDAVCYPKPVQKPHPTIMVGGSGEKYLLRVVAKHADRYNLPYGSPLQLQRKISVLKEHCTIIGRDYNEIEKSLILRCLIRETEDELHRNIRKWKRNDETAEHFKQRIDNNVVLGTPEHIVSELKKYIDLGVTHFILHFVGFNLQCLNLFNSKVIKKI